MPANFHLVSPAIWDRTQRELKGPAKVVRFYVLTCPTRFSEGLFRLSLGVLIHETGLSEQHARDGLAELEAKGLVSYDEDAEVVLDRTALKFVPLKNGTSVDKETGESKVAPDNRITGAVKKFVQVPESPLRDEFYVLALEYSPDLAAALLKEYPALASTNKQAPAKPLTSPSQAPSREDQESEPDKSGKRVCGTEGCSSPATWMDGDGFAFCDGHRGNAFGEVVRLAGVA